VNTTATATTATPTPAPVAVRPRRFPWLAALTVAGLIATVVMALWVAPKDGFQGDAYRLLYLHVPSAWLAYLAFGVTSIASLAYLVPRTRAMRWDYLAGASAELGVIFTALTLALGMLWAKPIWGAWWAWDARLTTTAVLFFLYLGYLALRRMGGAPQQRAMRSSVAALIAFVDVPIVHFSVTWWTTQHQDGSVFNEKMQTHIKDARMNITLILAVVSFTMLYTWLVLRRTQLLELEEGLAERELEAAIAERIGARPSSPAVSV
jgi:heme exporter protein C